LLPRKRLYPIVELELAAICFGLLKFKHYVYGKHIDVYSVNAPLRYLNSLSKHSSRLARYNTIIQEFDITLHHISGKRQIADALTRQEWDCDVYNCVWQGSVLFDLLRSLRVSRTPSCLQADMQQWRRLVNELCNSRVPGLTVANYCERMR